MSFTDEERKAVVSLRVNKAKETFEQATGIAGLQYWGAVVNRLYYACYYMASALLIQNGHAAQTHSGVIRLFGLHFVATNKVSKDSGRFYSRLFELRQIGDYDDVYNFEREEVEPLIESTRIFIQEIEKSLIEV